MSLALTNRVPMLKRRAQMLQRVRRFFEKREVIEVDVPALSTAAPNDPYIDVIEAIVCGKPAYLHTSPEYGMKQLLAEGIGDIYQLSHVFRDNEVGEKHSVEFTMVEWYRHGFTLRELIEESAELVSLFVDIGEVETLAYREAFEIYAGRYPSDLDERDYLFGFQVEPKLGERGLTVLTDYPPEQAMLAQVREVNGERVAERFELFYRGVELANGYHELADVGEQRKRLLEANRIRRELGKVPLPIDQGFLGALERGLPDCCGVAIGFDRLFQLQLGVRTIDESRVSF